MKLKHTAAAAMIAVSLSGCFTSTLWDKSEMAASQPQYRTVGEDKIHSFGMVGKEGGLLAKGSLVMMGEKYWFVVNPKDSADLTGILNMKLPEQFQMVQSTGYSGDRFQALPVTLKEQGSADFSTDVCLRYDAKNTEEAAGLKQLSFYTNEDMYGENTYFRCITAKGKYYGTPQNVEADYRFEKSIPVTIRCAVTKTGFNGAEVAGRVLLTPLTLAADATIGLVFLPFYLSADKFN